MDVSSISIIRSSHLCMRWNFKLNSRHHETIWEKGFSTFIRILWVLNVFLSWSWFSGFESFITLKHLSFLYDLRGLGNSKENSSHETHFECNEINQNEKSSPGFFPLLSDVWDQLQEVFFLSSIFPSLFLPSNRVSWAPLHDSNFLLTTQRLERVVFSCPHRRLLSVKFSQKVFIAGSQCHRQLRPASKQQQQLNSKKNSQFFVSQMPF